MVTVQFPLESALFKDQHQNGHARTTNSTHHRDLGIESDEISLCGFETLMESLHIDLKGKVFS